MSDAEAELRLPPKLVPLFTEPRGAYDYRGLFGGRGSAKSFSAAKMAAVLGVVEPMRILCVREMQVSIKESFHAELKAAIASEPWLAAAYDVGVDYLRSRINGTEFLFKGLYRNLGNVKSTAGIDLTIVEEAEDVSEDAWIALEATVLRRPRSEIWALWNPKDEDSPVDKRFRQVSDPRIACVELNYTDNPWFPEGLERLRLRQKAQLDAAKYAWIWEGAYYTLSDRVIFAGKWETGERTPDDTWHGPYFGLDFGFAQDPTAAVKVWISPEEDELYIEHEAGKVKLELDETAEYLKAGIPGIERATVTADSARPESISYLKRDRDPEGARRPHHLPAIEGAEKGPGSVEDGIDHLKTYRIVVNERCVEVINELKKYSYKVDRLTGDVLAVVVDKHNHYIDALRYAVERVMKAKLTQGLLLPKRLQKRRRA